MNSDHYFYSTGHAYMPTPVHVTLYTLTFITIVNKFTSCKHVFPGKRFSDADIFGSKMNLDNSSLFCPFWAAVETT